MSAKFKLAGHQIHVMEDEATPAEFTLKMTQNFAEKQQDDPFYVLNLSQVLARHREWVKLLPTITPFYAVKANPDPVLIQVLAWLGLGFDCASKGEIDLVKSFGVSADRIIYANTCKAPSFIRYAAAEDVTLMTFDNEDELKKIKQNCPNAKLVLRIAVLDPTSVAQLSKKFGASPKLKAPKLIELATELQLDLVGISFHVGGSSKNPLTYREGICLAAELFEFAKSLGHTMRLIDIGGGFPGFDSAEIRFASIAIEIKKALSDYFGNDSDLQIMAEPGRFYAMSSSSLLVNVIAKTSVPAGRITDNDEDNRIGYMYYVNDGIFGSFNCVPVYKINPPGISVRKPFETEKFVSRIWGPTCDSADCIWPEVQMPLLEIGDWIAFDCMGAYTKCISSEFNGFPAPKTIYLVNESDSKLLRMLQTLKAKQHRLTAPRNEPDADSDFSEESRASTVSMEALDFSE